jgi:hypothetical protein
MIRFNGPAFAAAALLLAACAPRPAPPAPAPPPAPPPPSPAPVPPPPADWRDAALSPGDWRLGSDNSLSTATFGAAGAASFVVRCEPGRQISLVRADLASASALVVRTTFGERSLAASARPGGATATLAASDPLLDQILFSRGRFLIRAQGAADLVLPTWPEPARVIEDCRG